MTGLRLLWIAAAIVAVIALIAQLLPLDLSGHDGLVMTRARGIINIRDGDAPGRVRDLVVRTRGRGMRRDSGRRHSCFCADSDHRREPRARLHRHRCSAAVFDVFLERTAATGFEHLRAGIAVGRFHAAFHMEVSPPATPRLRYVHVRAVRARDAGRGARLASRSWRTGLHRSTLGRWPVQFGRMGEPKPIDLDALMAEVRERIRIKREKGIYGPDVDALMRVPLPGGRRIFSDDLQDPLASLAEALDEEVEYDPRAANPSSVRSSRYARKVVISLVRWWMGAILERQERINRLLAAAYDYEGQMAPRFGTRLERLERRVEGAARARGRGESALGLLPGALRR